MNRRAARNRHRRHRPQNSKQRRRLRRTIARVNAVLKEIVDSLGGVAAITYNDNPFAKE